MGINQNGKGRACPGASRLPSRPREGACPRQGRAPRPQDGPWHRPWTPGPPGVGTASGSRPEAPGGAPRTPGRADLFSQDFGEGPAAAREHGAGRAGAGGIAPRSPGVAVKRRRAAGRWPAGHGDTRTSGARSLGPAAGLGGAAGSGPRENRQAAGRGEFRSGLYGGKPPSSGRAFACLCTATHAQSARPLTGPFSFETCETFLRGLRIKEPLTAKSYL